MKKPVQSVSKRKCGPATPTVLLEVGKRANAYSIHNHLRSQIISGKIPPGTVLSHASLARELGVSRTPVREAMRMLQNERLVFAEPNNRACVLGFSASELDALYATRIFLEPFGIALSIPRMTNAHLDELERNLDRMTKEERGDNFDQWMLEHRSFHRNLVAFCGDSLLQQLNRLLEQSTRFQYLFMKIREKEWKAKRGADHAALAEACRQRQPYDGYQLMLDHVAETALTLLHEFPSTEGRPPWIAIEGAIAIASAGSNLLKETGSLSSSDWIDSLMRKRWVGVGR